VGSDISTEEVKTNRTTSPRSERQHKAWGGVQRNPGKKIPTQPQTREAGDSGFGNNEPPSCDAETGAVAHFVGLVFINISFPGVPLRFTPGFMLPSASRTRGCFSCKPPSILRGIFLLALPAVFLGCHATSSVTPLSVRTLLNEYEKSAALTRQKYDGKEITVRGFAQSTALLPQGNGDQGSVWLQESDRESSGRVGCWFSDQQADDFSKIRAGEHLTIKGVFNGETGVDLKFCRLIKVE